MTLNQEHVTQLVLEAQSGNRAALGRLLRQYEDLMYPLALKYCGDEEVATDGVEALCSPNKHHGRWITRLDLESPKITHPAWWVGGLPNCI